MSPTVGARSTTERPRKPTVINPVPINASTKPTPINTYDTILAVARWGATA